MAAITRTLAEGISINVTLIFSVERYRAVMEAFQDGLEQAKAHGHDLSTIASVASFFVSRVDTEIDKRLTAIDSGIDHWGDRSFRRYGRTTSPAEHVRVRDPAGQRVAVVGFGGAAVSPPPGHHRPSGADRSIAQPK